MILHILIQYQFYVAFKLYNFFSKSSESAITTNFKRKKYFDNINEILLITGINSEMFFECK